ncbi:MAG: BPL-N domain-containing protein [Phycisphaerales bacterium]|nr:BPL-N domain-containing protein [Phycisphaerales bacterium]
MLKGARPALIDLVCKALFCALLLATTAHGQKVEEGIIASGTPFETRWRSYDSEVEGPTVLVIGGVHGNEPAGYRAARQIATWPVERGRLVVVPAANPPALAARERRIPGLEKDEGDLNRHFKVIDGAVAPSGPAAPALWAFVASVDPDVVLDLHEGYGFRAAGSKSVGTSIITHREKDDAAQKMMLAAANEGIEDPERRFVELNGIVEGSLARAVAVALEAEAHILETTWKDQPLSRRSRQHRRMVAARLADLGMQADPERAVNALVDPKDTRPLIALYDGGGAGSASQGRRFESQLPGCRVERLGPEDVQAGCLDVFDAVIFPGGSGSGQARAIGESGRAKVRKFVQGGGGYIGVCAGAYLALDNYSWSLRLIPMDSFDREHWRRGNASLELELTGDGLELFREPEHDLEIEFRQGPLMQPSVEPDNDSPVEILAWFRSGVGRNGADPATMVDTPAIVRADFGDGRVLLFSPHPEKTGGLEDWLRLAIDWTSEPEAELVETLTPAR